MHFQTWNFSTLLHHRCEKELNTFLYWQCQVLFFEEHYYRLTVMWHPAAFWELIHLDSIPVSISLYLPCTPSSFVFRKLYDLAPVARWFLSAASSQRLCSASATIQEYINLPQCLQSPKHLQQICNVSKESQCTWTRTKHFRWHMWPPPTRTNPI